MERSENIYFNPIEIKNIEAYYKINWNRLSREGKVIRGTAYRTIRRCSPLSSQYQEQKNR